MLLQINDTKREQINDIKYVNILHLTWMGQFDTCVAVQVTDEGERD